MPQFATQSTPFQTIWLYLFFIFFCVLLLTQSLRAEETIELDLLEEFGLEIFATDPVKQAEMEEKKEQERIDALPPFIAPETLDTDAQLDATILEVPKEPTWEPVEHEIAHTSYNSQECCLRAIRASRYVAESECEASGKEVWQLESVPIKYDQGKSIRQHKLCEVFYNEESTAEIQEPLTHVDTSLEEFPPPEPDFYLCRARSLAKCFAPTGENAIFSSESFF